MSKITDPTEKKALAYEKDHRDLTEFPHTFRTVWPRKKARANRKYRRQVHQYVNDSEQAILEGAELSTPPLRRGTVRKWGAVPLSKWVADQKEMRLRRTAWNFFKRPYDREMDQQRFSRFLATITQGRTAASREIAKHFGEMLAPPDPSKPPYHPHIAEPLPREWLAAFLADTPEWDQRLRAWIASMEQS